MYTHGQERSELQDVDAPVEWKVEEVSKSLLNRLLLDAFLYVKQEYSRNEVNTDISGDKSE